MKVRTKKTEHIRDYIFHNITKYPNTISTQTAKKFGFSRQAANKHIRNLVDEGLLVATGSTRDRTYHLATLASTTVKIPITQTLEEHIIWEKEVAPLLQDLKKNVKSVCHYGFTEMFNNVIEHSGGSEVTVTVEYQPVTVLIRIHDNGVGIFKKIYTELSLDDEKHAIFELSKGKLTTDPENHTGEGIFFTSRAFDIFSIISDELAFIHFLDTGDWLIEGQTSEIQGTGVLMEINLNSKRQMHDVFSEYSEADTLDFSKTSVPVRLAEFGDYNLVSRSQAKRLLARFDRFKVVYLDFKGVTSIGQAFADEVFRVFPNEHPEIELKPVRMNSRVTKRYEAIIERNKGQARLF